MATSFQNLLQSPQQSLPSVSSNAPVINHPQSQNSSNSVDELVSIFRPMRPTADEVDNTLEAIFQEVVDDISLGVIFDVHRAVKKGYFLLSDTDDETLKQFEIIDRPGFDIFGQLPPARGKVNGGASSTGSLNNQYECCCPNCGRNLATNRFAPHLEKCMIGSGRTSGRLASRRLADLGAYMFAERCASSASSDTASSASRSSLGEDDFEWTTSNKKAKRPRTSQRKQVTNSTQASDSNSSQPLVAPLTGDYRTAPVATVLPGGATPRRQPSSASGGNKRSRQKVSKTVDKIENITGLKQMPSSTPLNVGNVFDALTASLCTASNSSSGSSSTAKGKLV